MLIWRKIMRIKYKWAVHAACIAFVTFTAVPEAHAQQTASVIVNVTDLRNAIGKVWVCMWREDMPNHFPNCDSKIAVAKLSAPAVTPTVTFVNVKPGKYAIGLFHDEKEIGHPVYNFIGMPTSGVGLSNNPAIGVTSRPSFAKSSFTVGLATITETIKIRYLF